VCRLGAGLCGEAEGGGGAVGGEDGRWLEFDDEIVSVLSAEDVSY
jgi:hypothetical protein